MIIIGVDTETTSIEEDAEIIELGVAIYDTKTKLEIKSFSQLFTVSTWSEEAEKVHGIPKDLCDRFGINPALYNLLESIGSDILNKSEDVVFLAHYAKHDYTILIKYWPELSKHLWICTNDELDHNSIINKVSSTRLSHLAVDYGLVGLDKWHRALPDANMCCRLALKHDLEEIVERKKRGEGCFKVIASGPYDKGHNEFLKEECKFKFNSDDKSWYIICDEEDVSLYMKLAEHDGWTITTEKIGIG